MACKLTRQTYRCVDHMTTTTTTTTTTKRRQNLAAAAPYQSPQRPPHHPVSTREQELFVHETTLRVPHDGVSVNDALATPCYRRTTSSWRAKSGWSITTLQSLQSPPPPHLPSHRTTTSGRHARPHQSGEYSSTRILDYLGTSTHCVKNPPQRTIASQEGKNASVSGVDVKSSPLTSFSALPTSAAMRSYAPLPCLALALTKIMYCALVQSANPSDSSRIFSASSGSGRT